MKKYFKINVILVVILVLLSFSIIFINNFLPKIVEKYKKTKVKEYKEVLKEKNIKYFKMNDDFDTGYEKVYINNSKEAQVFLNRFEKNKKIMNIDYSKNTVFFVEDVRNNGCANKETRVLVFEYNKRKPEVYFKTIIYNDEAVCPQYIVGKTYAVVVPNTLLENADMSEWKTPSKAYKEKIEKYGYGYKVY